MPEPTSAPIVPTALTDRERVVRRVADHLAARRPGGRLRVAVDGITAAGKTTLARELAEAIRRAGRPALALSMDGFHHPRAHRRRQGAAAAVGYYQDAYDFGGLVAALLDPLGPDGDGRYRARIHDLATDERLDEPPVQAEPSLLVVVDGTFLQRPGPAGHWDEVIWLDTAFEVALARAIPRDSRLFGGPDATREAYLSRYHAACRLYQAQHDPASTATVVIGNDDLAHPQLRRIGGPARAAVQLFSYGTLQLPDVQREHFGRVLSGAPDGLPGHRTDWLTITDPEVIRVSGTDRHPVVRAGGPGDSATGTVLDLTAEELAAADRYEVDDYRRFLVRLASGRQAWVYLSADQEPRLSPAADGS
jgi:uridine kinase